MAIMEIIVIMVNKTFFKQQLELNVIIITYKYLLIVYFVDKHVITDYMGI